MKLIIYLLLALLLIFTVSANQPSPEVDCCFDIREGFNNSPVCQTQENLTAEKCTTILAEWNQFLNEFNREATEYLEMERSCCTYMLRGYEAPDECVDFNTDYTYCENLIAGYMGNFKGVPSFTDAQLIGISVGIVAIFWFIIRRKG